jgi:hypothetical protein
MGKGEKKSAVYSLSKLPSSWLGCGCAAAQPQSQFDAHTASRTKFAHAS